MAFLPLPKVVADVGPGGGLVTAMQGMNALSRSNLENAYQALQNQYYAPNIESQIAERNALTQGYNIANKYAPDRLRLANLLSQQQYEYNPSIWQSEIGLRNAQKQQAIENANKLHLFNTNPGFYGGEDAKTIAALRLLGYLPDNQVQQPPASNITNIPQIPTNPIAQNPATNVSAPMNPMAQQTMQVPSTNAMQQIPFNPSAPFHTGDPLSDAILNRRYAQPAYQQKMGQAFDWVHSTPEAKTYEIALGAGMGLTPDKLVHERSQGKSISQIAQENGYNPNNLPAPDFLPTRQNIATLKRRQAALAEVDSLGKFVREGLAPFARTFQGYSIPQVAQALTGYDEKQQIKFLAARMLTPELANIRQNLAQGNAGVTAAQEIMNRSLMDHKVFQGLVSPKVYLKSQELADQVLKDAFKNAEKVYQVPRKKEEKEKKLKLKPVHEMTTEEINEELAKIRKK